MAKNIIKKNKFYIRISQTLILILFIIMVTTPNQVKANIFVSNDTNNYLFEDNSIQNITSTQYEFESRYKYKITRNIKKNNTITNNNAEGGILKPPVQIDVTLKDDISNNVKVNDEVTVNYEIGPKDIDFSNGNNNTESKKIEEAIFVVDLSQKMNSGRRDSLLVNAFTNQILDKDINYIKFGVVGYNQSAYVGDVESYEPKKSLMKQVTSIDVLKEPLVSTYGNAKDAFRLLFQGGDNSLKSLISNNDTRNIDTALRLADDILTQKGDNSKGKAIVIISSGKFSEYNNETIKRIRGKGYRIITLDVSNNIEEQSLIETLHEQLGGVTGGEKSDHIKAMFDGNSGDILNVDDTMKDVADKLRGNTIAVNNEKKVNATLNFDVGDYLEYIGGSNSENVSISNNESKMTINLPEINYTDDDGDGIYKASKFNISFKLKVTGKGNGTVTFNSPEDKEVNNIYYLDFYNRENKNLVDTPNINVVDEFSINANLIGVTPNYPYLDDEIAITYEIDPKAFIKDNSGGVSINNAELVFNLGDNFNLVDNQSGVEVNDNGEVILNLADKINYKYDVTNNKYTAEKFTISFKVKGTKVGQKISFEKSQIKYADILGYNNSIIEKDIENPFVTVRQTETIPSYNGPDIRILEIEPADSFKLTKNSSGKATTGTEPESKADGSKDYIIENVGDKEYKVEIVHMTMSEFIGKVDDLNGKYDVVVIGNNIENSINSKYNFNNKDNSESYVKADGYENYNNDISKRKGDEITNFINSGQLVFIDKMLSNIEESKLKGFVNGDWNKQLINVIKDFSISDNSLNLSKIISKYDEIILNNPSKKRAKLISSIPEDDSGNSSDQIGSVYKRYMRFNIKADGLSDEEVTINLYLDINGDGLFKREEIVNTIEDAKISTEGYRIDYDFYKDNPLFIGYLDWRIEIVRKPINNYSESIKSYYDGNVLFRRITEEKRKINVLQVSPYSVEELKDESKNRKTNLIQNPNFMKLLSDLSDYDIKIDVISYSQFYNGNNTYEELVGKKLKDSKYNIVIVGFGDTYKGKDLTKEAIEEVKAFIKSGQGLMLTHDTIFNEGNNLFKSFRDIAGQARYLDKNNPQELDVDGVNTITHDNDILESDRLGESLWKTYDYGVRNGNSTRVYKVNESLLTTYPYELGEYITIRRTHGQYYELNLEDENVVPSFTLTNYNIDQSGKTNRNAKADMYDVRNNYYTYSKGNITFSGTGEDGRENTYPEQELKLFVNTIVKAERGANHKPEITALENIKEVPYNSELVFNAIVKDIDGDKVRINKITVDGNGVNGYLVPTEYKEQGVGSPVTISSNNFKDKVNKEVKIIIEAEDSKGAVTVKEYTITPIMSPILTAGQKKINSLVGENVEFQIKLNRENDTNPSSISISHIQVPDTFGKVELKDVKTKMINGETYLVGSLKSLVESTGEEISISIIYNNGIAELKTLDSKIILNSKKPNVSIVVKGNDSSNLGINPKITLLNSETNSSYENNVSIIDGRAIFTTLNSGKYEMRISGLVGYTITSISINGTNISNINNVKFDVNYENSSKSIEIIVVPQVSSLTHGLYEGINEEGNVSILQNEDGFKLVAGSSVNFGSTFILGGNGSKIRLSIDSKLEQTTNNDINKNNIKVYKVEKKDGKTKLNKFNSSSLEIKYNNSNYEISIKESISNNTEILILYTAKIPKDSINKEYTNIITINDISRKVKVYTIQGETDKDVYLPDLF